jgi:hypothetical protein
MPDRNPTSSLLPFIQNHAQVQSDVQGKQFLLQGSKRGVHGPYSLENHVIGKGERWYN